MYSGAIIGARLNGSSGFSALRPRIVKPHPAAQWNIQAVRGKVTVRCLWQACKALLVGFLLILVGAAMATVGYYADELAMEERPHGNTTVKIKNATKVFHLNNLTYVGPIIMGCGGFVIVAAVVMTFEARDSAVKIVPARFRTKLDAVTTATTTGGPTTAGPTSNGTTGAATLRACYHDTYATDNESFDRASYAPSGGSCHNSHHHHHDEALTNSRLAVTGAFLRFSRSLRGSSVESGDSNDPSCASRATTAPHHHHHRPPQPPPAPLDGSLRRCPSAPALMSEFHLLQSATPHHPFLCHTARDPRATSRQPSQLPAPDVKRLQVSLLPRQAISMDNSDQAYHSQHYSEDSVDDYEYEHCHRRGDAILMAATTTTSASEVDLEISTSALSMHETDSDSSMTMDLHLDRPVTLTVKDESKRHPKNGDGDSHSPGSGSPRSPTSAAVGSGTSPRSPHPNVRFQTGGGKTGGTMPPAAELSRRETSKRRPLLRQTKVEHVDDDIFDVTVGSPPGHTAEGEAVL